MAEKDIIVGTFYLLSVVSLRHQSTSLWHLQYLVLLMIQDQLPWQRCYFYRNVHIHKREIDKLLHTKYIYPVSWYKQHPDPNKKFADHTNICLAPGIEPLPCQPATRPLCHNTFVFHFRVKLLCIVLLFIYYYWFADKSQVTAFQLL